MTETELKALTDQKAKELAVVTGRKELLFAVAYYEKLLRKAGFRGRVKTITFEFDDEGRYADIGRVTTTDGRIVGKQNLYP